MKKERDRIILRTRLIGVLINLLLVVMKLIVGIVSHSVAVVSDAVNNLMDMGSAVVTLVGVKLAGKEADTEHPYGHGRIEYLATVIVGGIILLTGVITFVDAVPKIWSAEKPEFDGLGFFAVGTAVVVKLLFGLFVKKKGQEVGSGSLRATGIDALFDALLTFGTLASGVVAKVCGVSIDGIVGAIIALFIVRSGIEIFLEGGADIIGRRVDQGLYRKIKGQIVKTPGVEGVKELTLHSYGPSKVIGAVKIKVSPEMKAKKIQEISEDIAQEMLDKHDVEIIVGIYTEEKK